MSTLMKEADVISDVLLDNPMVIIDECTIVAPLSDQPAFEKQVLVQMEIHPILTNTLVPESVMFVDIVDPILDLPEVEDQVQTCAYL